MPRIERTETFTGLRESMIESPNGSTAAIDADDLRPEDLKTKPWDLADRLRDDDEVAHFLAVVLQEDDPPDLRRCFGDVARAYGRAELVRNTDCGRESLYSALAAREDIRAETVLGLLADFGLRLGQRSETEYEAEPVPARAVAENGSPEYRDGEEE